MVGVSIDITERKLAEDRVRDRFLIANRKFLRVRNMTKEQVVGHYAHEILNPGGV